MLVVDICINHLVKSYWQEGVKALSQAPEKSVSPVYLGLAALGTCTRALLSILSWTHMNGQHLNTLGSC